MNESIKSEVIKAIQQANEDVVWCFTNCQVMSDDRALHGKSLKILSPNLEHVLKAIQSDVHCDSDGNFLVWDFEEDGGFRIHCTWQFGKPLDQQEDSVWEFLHKILC